MFSPFNRDERDALLRRRAEALIAYEKAMTVADKSHPWSSMEQTSLERAEGHLKNAINIEQRYFQKLPRVPVACCPFDNKPLYRSFDPFGMDGLWWRSDSTPPEPIPCTHFCFVTGAVAPGDVPLSVGDFEVAAGPEVPFVIPRILELEGVIAVISQIELENGAIVYPICYFAEKRPPTPQWAASWRRRHYSYVGQLGETGWRMDNESWDFDLLPWIEAGRLRWCLSGDNTVLSQESAECCPYIDLPGRRERIIVQGDHSWPEGLTTGVAVVRRLNQTFTLK